MTDKILLMLTESIEKLLDEDQSRITYRPTFAALSGGVTSAILLERIRWYWRKKGQKPFYKFNDKCGHPLYREGDSWQEELGFDRGEFEGARKRIATRVTKGMDKSSLTHYADEDGNLRGVEFIVLYWRDGDSLMWYQVNELLLKAHLLKAYHPEIPNAEILHYLEMLKNSTTYLVQESSITFTTESPSEITPLSIGADVKKDAGTSDVPPRKRHPIFYTVGMRYADGKPVDPATFPEEVNVLFYAYFDVLEDVNHPTMATYDYLWEKLRDECKSLALARVTAEQLQGYVRSKYDPNNKLNDFWINRDDPLPLSNVVKSIGSWIKRQDRQPGAAQSDEAKAIVEREARRAAAMADEQAAAQRARREMSA